MKICFCECVYLIVCESVLLTFYHYSPLLTLDLLLIIYKNYFGFLIFNHLFFFFIFFIIYFQILNDFLFLDLARYNNFEFWITRYNQIFLDFVSSILVMFKKFITPSMWEWSYLQYLKILTTYQKALTNNYLCCYPL